MRKEYASKTSLVDKRMEREARKNMKIPIYSSGEPVRRAVVYEVLCGKVGLVRSDIETDKTRIVEVFGKGDLVGLDDIYNDNHSDSARLLTIDAVVRTKKIDLQDLSNLKFLQRETEKRIKKQEEILDLMKSSYATEKVAFALLDLADARNTVTVSYPDISSRIGINLRETTRVITSFRKEEIIDTSEYRKLKIKEPEVLLKRIERKGA